jgi:hypothetical protein
VKEIALFKEDTKRFTGITQVYFDYFVLGKQSFTATKAAFRRTIFDDLNTASYDYALGVHAKIKGDIRDNVAVLKHLTKRLTTLELERVDDARLKEMEDALTLVSSVAVTPIVALRPVKSPINKARLFSLPIDVNPLLFNF